MADSLIISLMLLLALVLTVLLVVILTRYNQLFGDQYHTADILRKLVARPQRV